MAAGSPFMLTEFSQKLDRIVYFIQYNEYNTWRYITMHGLYDQQDLI